MTRRWPDRLREALVTLLLALIVASPFLAAGLALVLDSEPAPRVYSMAGVE